MIIGAVVSTAILLVAGIAYLSSAPKRSTTSRRTASVDAKVKATSVSRPRAQNIGPLTLYWDQLPDNLEAVHREPAATENIHRDDYVGPEACKNCHKAQHANWSNHPHRWMNALADEGTVKGDFNDRRISYLGGEITFTKVDGTYRMRLQRGDVKRDYLIDQTIGSRFFQYYIGKQLSGPEPRQHPLYFESHVLPIGYWIDRDEWIPIVHVHDDFQDSTRHDPFESRGFTDDDKDLLAYSRKTQDLYRAQCNYCHTTFPIGEMFIREQNLMASFAPVRLDLLVPEYLSNTRPDFWSPDKKSQSVSTDEYLRLLRDYKVSDAREHAATLGISCEACHLGCKDHAQGKLKKPKFLPEGKELVVAGGSPHEQGRTHDNVNWACGRCHTGSRQLYAAGMSTWNSTEYSDAMRGHCYSKLTCITCHNPHEPIGHEWKRTPIEDDAICLNCHQQFQPDANRIAHTHHQVGGEGSHCMDCHMPRINEGLQEVVRTHTIFSPTNSKMIENNQMNACNQCHVDKTIDWTRTYLKDWYGKSYSDENIAKNYPDRKQPAAINWLKGPSENVRLVAADSLTRANARWALPELIDSLDDPFMLNRQFTRIGLERMQNIRLKDFGYEFQMTADERKAPLKRLRDILLNQPAEK